MFWTIPNTTWTFRWVRHRNNDVDLQFDHNYEFSDCGPSVDLSQDPFDYIEFFPDLIDDVCRNDDKFYDVVDYEDDPYEYRYRCDCGSIIEQGSIGQHFNTLKHKTFLKNNPDSEPCIRTVEIRPA